MKKERVKLNGDIWEFVDDKLNIVNPNEVIKTFNDSDLVLFEYQYNGILKGMEFSKKDYEKLVMELSITNRVDDVINLGHIYKRQIERDSILDDLYYHQGKKIFKMLIDTENIEEIKLFLNDVYQDEIGVISDNILEIDAHYMIDKIKKSKEKDDFIDSLLK